MNARYNVSVHVECSPDEWLEVAAHLPRSNNYLRAHCLGRASEKGSTWADFNGDDWTLFEDAAVAAGVLSSHGLLKHGPKLERTAQSS